MATTANKSDKTMSAIAVVSGVVTLASVFLGKKKKK